MASTNLIASLFEAASYIVSKKRCVNFSLTTDIRVRYIPL